MPREEKSVLTPQPGTVVGQKYRVVRTLGEGGMGTVYEAENTLTQKRAAIKWLHPRLLESDHAGKRLLYEARAAARIQHRNVVNIYDVIAEGSSVFLVMELLEGEPLSARLATSDLLLTDLIRLLLPAMAGVAAAHAAHVVHRDIKPDNILLAREHGTGEIIPKIIDFGISRVFEADGSRLTRSGMTMGTPKYVSYEQLRGARDVDGRADVYAFGVILYEALTGAPPYEASTLGEQAISFITTEPAPPRILCPELPEELSELIMRAIQREREHRIASMQELIAELRPFADSARYPVAIKARPLKSTNEALRPVAFDATTTPEMSSSERSSYAAGGAGPSQQPMTLSVARPSPPPAHRARAGRRHAALAALGVLLVSLTWLAVADTTAITKRSKVELHAPLPVGGEAVKPPVAPPVPEHASAAAPPRAAAEPSPSPEAGTVAPKADGPDKVRTARKRAARVTEQRTTPASIVSTPALVAPETPDSTASKETAPANEAAHRAGGLRREEF